MSASISGSYANPPHRLRHPLLSPHQEKRAGELSRIEAARLVALARMGTRRTGRPLDLIGHMALTHINRKSGNLTQHGRSDSPRLLLETES
jgi:hypothetical protein